MSLTVNITKRERKRRLKSGDIVINERWVVQWTDPKSGARLQRFFERKRDAEALRSELVISAERGTYSAKKQSLTVAEAIASLIEHRRMSVRPATLASYQHEVRYIIGPLLPRDARQAKVRSGKGAAPLDAQSIPLLGPAKVATLSTRDIRNWHRLICEEVSLSGANRAKQLLHAALELAAEDFEFRPPAMPKGLPRKKGKERKLILNPQQIAQLIEQAKTDLDKGIYYAFPFFTGTRPSEQLGLTWTDIDFDANTISIRRTQLKGSGDLSELTKTDAGTRTIPLAPTLRTMLLEWRIRCPLNEGRLDRVFPAQGNQRCWPLPRENGGGPLYYNNFRTRYWVPALKRAGLPPVTPHSARHSYISGLQTHGAEVGLAARLAGHKSPVVTLQYYTHSMRAGDDVVAALDRALGRLDSWDS